MKKIVFTFILAFLMFVQTPLYVQYNISELEGFLNNDCYYTDIKSTGDIKSVEDFSKAISEFTENEDAFVATLSYNSQLEKSEITELYISGNNIPASLRRKGITDDTLKKIYNLNTNTGVRIKLFNPSKQCAIYNFEGLKDKSLSRTYYIYPSEKGESFQKYMTENYNVDFFTSEELLYIHTEYIDQIPGVALMMAALLVFFSFWIVSQYQLNAVKKLCGYSDCRNILDMVLQFIFITLLAVIFSYIIQFVLCGIYNRWVGYTNIFIDYVKICIPIFIVLVVAGVLFSFLFYSSDVKYALKGRRPYRILNICAAILKVITIVFLCSSVTNIVIGINQSSNILKQKEEFEKVANYHITQIQMTSGSADYMSKFENNSSNFYKALDGVLISNQEIVNNRYNSDVSDDITDNILANTVFINTNYLEINPIYDTFGKPIKINEASIKANKTIVLVPEKYKSQEKDIYQSFYDWYKFARYVTVPTTELPKEERKVEIELVFVNNNQNYFAFETTEQELNFNYIKDPFAVIVTKNNMDKSEYSKNIINGKYLLFENKEQTIDEIFRIADATGISEDLVNAPTVISCVDELMQQCKSQVISSLMFLVLSIIIVAIISIYIIKNYMDQNKKMLFVKKMLGYPMFGVYGKFIFVVTGVQLLIFVILKFAINMTWGVWVPTSLIFIFVDFIIMWVTAAKYQSSLTKNVLKGEEI